MENKLIISIKKYKMYNFVFKIDADLTIFGHINVSKLFALKKFIQKNKNSLQWKRISWKI